MERVITLLKALTTKIEKEGSDEQAAYDKYSCWVENQLGAKASAISTAKSLISDLQTQILKHKAAIATHDVEARQAQKDIAENVQSTKDSTAMRTKENTAFTTTSSELQQNIDALTGSIATLNGAGTFLSVNTRGAKKVHDTQLLSVSVNLHAVMMSSLVQEKLSADEVDAVNRFVQDPQEFVSHDTTFAQTGNNPSGDFAPASGQIQGILKGMKDSLTTDLAQANTEESSSVKDFNSLMSTKTSELTTLKDGLQSEQTALAKDTKSLADAQLLQDQTEAQLEADEEFFADTKEAASNKATEWSTRVRMRVEELSGMKGAIDILAGGMATLKTASTTFVQLKAKANHVQDRHSHDEALHHVEKLSEKYQSEHLQKVVAALKSGGQFDKVIAGIDSKIKLLRAEEKADIEHRDRCQEKENDNANDLADAVSGVSKATTELTSMANQDAALDTALAAMTQDIKTSKESLASAKNMRDNENAEFKQALKMDSEAMALVIKAGASLASYSAMLQVAGPAPKFLSSLLAPPDTDFAAADKHTAETGNVVAILDMIVEDFKKEMQEGKADEATAQADYNKQKAALNNSLDAQKATKVSLEKQKADLKAEVTRTGKVQDEQGSDKAAAEAVKKAVAADCSWVKTDFASRRTKRKTEIDGLVDAKDFMAGVAAGRAVLPVTR